MALCHMPQSEDGEAESMTYKKAPRTLRPREIGQLFARQSVPLYLARLRLEFFGTEDLSTEVVEVLGRFCDFISDDVADGDW